MGTLYVVIKGEEGVRAKSYTIHLVQPLSLLLAGQRLRSLGEYFLPLALSQHIHVVLAHIYIDSIIAVRSGYTLFEGQVEYLRTLTKQPVVGCLSGQTCAVDAGLLSCADTDGLSAFNVAYRVGLCIFQSDHGNDQIALSILRDIGGVGYDLAQESFIDGHLVSSLLKSDAKYLFVLNGLRLVSRIDLDHIVVAVFLCFQDFQSFRLISRSDNTVRNLSLDQFCGISVTYVRQRYKITERRHTVSAAGSGVSTCQRGQISHIVYPVDLSLHLIQRKTYSGTCWRNVLEGGGCRKSGSFFQLTDKLPAV